MLFLSLSHNLNLDTKTTRYSAIQSQFASTDITFLFSLIDNRSNVFLAVVESNFYLQFKIRLLYESTVIGHSIKTIDR